MVRQGPVPVWLHGSLEYVLGLVFIVAPFLLGFESGAAKAVAIIAGLVVLIMAATTAGPTGIVSQLPVSVHILLDYALAGVLVASPFLFGFSSETNPTAFFIAAGVVHLLVTIATRFVRGRAKETAAGGARPA